MVVTPVTHSCRYKGGAPNIHVLQGWCTKHSCRYNGVAPNIHDVTRMLHSDAFMWLQGCYTSKTFMPLQWRYTRDTSRQQAGVTPVISHYKGDTPLTHDVIARMIHHWHITSLQRWYATDTSRHYNDDTLVLHYVITWVIHHWRITSLQGWYTCGVLRHYMGDTPLTHHVITRKSHLHLA